MKNFDRTLPSHGTVKYFCPVLTELWMARRLNFRSVIKGTPVRTNWEPGRKFSSLFFLMQPLYLVKVPLSIFQWLQMALFAVFLGLLKFLSNVRTLTLYSQKSLFWKYKLRKCIRVSQTFKNCSRSSLWAQGFSGCYSLFFFLLVKLCLKDVSSQKIHSSRLSIILYVWKRNERDLHQWRPNFIFIVKKCT